MASHREAGTFRSLLRTHIINRIISCTKFQIISEHSHEPHETSHSSRVPLIV